MSDEILLEVLDWSAAVENDIRVEINNVKDREEAWSCLNNFQYQVIVIPLAVVIVLTEHEVKDHGP